MFRGFRQIPLTPGSFSLSGTWSSSRELGKSFYVGMLREIARRIATKSLQASCALSSISEPAFDRDGEWIDDLAKGLAEV